MKLILSLGLLLMLSGCTKYPEDDFISFLTPEQRLAANPWYIQKLFVDGIDSTQLFLQNAAGPLRIGFSKNSKQELTGFTDSYGGWGGAAIRNNGLEIQYLIDCSKGGCSYYNVFRPGTQVWRISKLFKDELIIKNQINGKIYDVYFSTE